ncbi:MAG: hypothetical protein GX159_01265 [Flavobacteriaceae bacterium]|nr:hypothetical protein [Flavobacteriaceae bacterium]
MALETLQLFIGLATYIQVVTFLISLLTWNKYKHTRLKYLPILLGLNAFLEFFCYHFYKQDNAWLYNIKSLFEFNFLCFIFFGYLAGLTKKISWGLIVLYNLAFLFIQTISQGFQPFLMPYTYVLSSIIFIIIIMMVFNEMLKLEGIEGITKNLLFWIAAGYFVFYATSFPIFSISNLKEVLGSFQVQAVKVLLFAVLIMHTIFIIGFLWSKKKYSY